MSSSSNKILQALRVVNEQFNKDGEDTLVEQNAADNVTDVNDAVAESVPIDAPRKASDAPLLSSAELPLSLQQQQPLSRRKRSVAENRKTSMTGSATDPAFKDNGSSSFVAPSPRKQSISIQQFDMPRSFPAGGADPASQLPQHSLQPLVISPQILTQTQTQTQKERVNSLISVPPLPASPPAHVSRRSSTNPQPPGGVPSYASQSFSHHQHFNSIELSPEQSASMHLDDEHAENTHEEELASLFAKLSPTSDKGGGGGERVTSRTVVIPSPKPDRNMTDSPGLDSYSSIMLPAELSLMVGYESSVNSAANSPFHENNYFAPIHSNHLQQGSMHSIDSDDEGEEGEGDDRHQTHSVYTAATGQSSGGQTHSMEAILGEVMKIFDRKMGAQKAKTDKRFRALEGNSNQISSHVNKVLSTMRQMNAAAKSQRDVTIRADGHVKRLVESVQGVERRMQQETVGPLQNNITSCLEHIVTLERALADQDKQIEAIHARLLGETKAAIKPVKKDMFVNSTAALGPSDFSIESTQAFSNAHMDFVSTVQDVTQLAVTFKMEEQRVEDSHVARVELGTSLLGEQQQKVCSVHFTPTSVCFICGFRSSPPTTWTGCCAS
jgi:hypothetical protein